ncbi:hypothetical protein J6590_038806 [Homalodisca vitripennis]|nr:hypothetical protein J6590_038806 [Homalodisca vitripennis]
MEWWSATCCPVMDCIQTRPSPRGLADKGGHSIMLMLITSCPLASNKTMYTSSPNSDLDGAQLASHEKMYNYAFSFDERRWQFQSFLQSRSITAASDISYGLVTGSIERGTQLSPTAASRDRFLSTNQQFIIQHGHSPSN